MERLKGADPRKLRLVFDFDGTLAPIVQRPEDAAIDPQINRLLDQISLVFGQPAVVSGRDRETLERLVPGLLTIGSYGLELPPSLSPTGFPPGFDPDQARQALDAARRQLEALARRWSGSRLEVKRWGLAVHFRGSEAAFRDPEIAGNLAAVAARHGLQAATGRLVYELRPAGIDKGWVVEYLVDQLQPSAVVYVGDDLGDVPAWNATRGLSGRLPALTVGIASGELDAAAMKNCDVVLSRQEELAGFLQALLQTISG